MKIKIIDLLNKIANGEEVPKKILLNGIIFEYQGDDYLYKDKDKKEHWLFSVSYTDKYMWLENFLKAEAEIIEETKKIEKISWSEKESLAGNLVASKKQEILARRTEKLKSSLNELIDEINNLKEND